MLDYEAKSFPKWTQFVFQKYVIKQHGIALDYSNTCPFLVPGFEFLHDIYCKLYPQDFTSRRDKLVRLYSNMMYRTIAKRAKAIFTVSEYTKQTIIDTYRVNPDRIHVVYSGVSEYKNIPADDIRPLFPYTSPMTKEGFFRKYEYAYDEYYDCYICRSMLMTNTTTAIYVQMIRY